MGILIRLIVAAAALYGAWQVGRRIAGLAPPPEAPKPRARGTSIEDMAKCPVCGSYVAASAGPCGRADCPRR